MLNAPCVRMADRASGVPPSQRDQSADRIYPPIATECCEFLHIWKRTRLTHTILSWFRGDLQNVHTILSLPEHSFWLLVIHFSTYSQDSVALLYAPDCRRTTYSHLFVADRQLTLSRRCGRPIVTSNNGSEACGVPARHAYM